MAKHSMSSYKASMVKKIGHSEEVKFNFLFGNNTLDNLNFSGASEDCIVEKEDFKSVIKKELNYNENDFTVSLKSGKTWQFHLGVINEISTLDFIKKNISTKVLDNGKDLTIVKYSKSFEEQLKVLKSYSFWAKYLKKGSLLCYNEKEHQSYTFFEMNMVINSIIKHVKWRILESGRIKGDCIINNKLCSGVITLEFRNDDHKQCLVLGSSGGSGKSANGYRLFLFLKEKIKSICIKPLN